MRPGSTARASGGEGHELALFRIFTLGPGVIAITWIGLWKSAITGVPPAAKLASFGFVFVADPRSWSGNA